MSAKPLVLFVCIGNTCRSPMAEGLFRSIAGDRFEAASAGIDGYWDAAQPATILTMREKGIDISSHKCRDITEFADRDIHTVFTLDPAVRPDATRVLRRARGFIHWNIPDPYMGTRGNYARIRDDLETRLKDWLAEHAS